MSPDSGSTSGGATVTVTGTSFTTTLGVTIDGAPISDFTVVDDSTITLTTPTHAAGEVNIAVTNGAATTAATPDDAFTFVAAPVYVSGTITTDTLWSPAFANPYIIQGVVDVPAGVTLTVAAGTVIKAFDGQFCTDIPDIACSMSVEGTLTVAGTSGSPVVFTSMNDNTVGGVTGTGSPTPGDWYGVIVSGSGSVDATYPRVDWARLPMWADTTGSVVFDHDTFANDANGVGVIAPEPVLTDNMATNLGSQPSVGSNSYSPAYAVWSSTLNLDNITGNNAAGGDPVFFVAGTAVDSTMNPNQIPFAGRGRSRRSRLQSLRSQQHRVHPRRAGGGDLDGGGRNSHQSLRWSVLHRHPGYRVFDVGGGDSHGGRHVWLAGGVHLDERQHRGRGHRHREPDAG